MISILIFSQNRKTIEDAKQTLEKGAFSVHSFSIFEPLNIKFEKFKLIIMDICNLDIQGDHFYHEFFAKIAATGLPVLLVIDGIHADILQKIKGILPVFRDLVFDSRIKEELFTRISIILAESLRKLPENCIISGNLILNLDKYELTVNNIEVELTFKEYELLKLLLENPDKVYSRNKLLSIIWGYDFYGGSRTVDVHMRRLRSKLELPYSDMLKTVRNVGYMFSPVL
jgi:two-component system, OmpR family, alkaline phosphatase synthesis response regulator PhoP